MLRKNISKCVICSLISFLLCSFTTQTRTNENIDQEEFNYQISQLDEDLDKKNALQDEYEEYLDFDNELTNEEQDIIQDYIHIEDNKIELSDDVYQVMPTNDSNLSISEYKEIIGLEYQQGNKTYFRNYKAISFVNDNINLMNELSANEYGTILDDGTMDLNFNENSRRSTFIIKEFSTGWFKMSFVTDGAGSLLFGALGVGVNYSHITNIYKYLNADYSEWEECFQDVLWDLFSDVESYFGSIFLDHLTDIISSLLTCLDILTTSSTIVLVIKIVTYILSRYLPGFLKGILMILSGYYFGASTKATVGLNWSNYDIILS